VYVAARSAAKGEAAVASIRAVTGSGSVFFLALDLADLESVRACAEGFAARGEPLHALVNNAGIAGARGLTKQGFELMFGVNHLGHFGHLAAGPVAGAAAGHPAHAVGGRGRGDVAVLCDLAGGGGGQRAVLRQVRSAASQPGGDPRTRRGAVEAQRGLDRCL
jgi:NAD(P)-dependent dehydrogenase (short-subunit alcohol dehydrogenase family)